MKRITAVLLAAALLTLSACNEASEGQVIDLTESDNAQNSLPNQADNNAEAGISDIPAGNGYVLILTNDGRVFFRGENYLGIDGYDYGTQINSPIEIPTTQNITKTKADDGMAVFAGADGSVYTIGNDILDTNGVYGEGRIISIPEKIGQIDGISQIATSGWHVSVLTENGEVYSMGTNMNFALGLNAEQADEFTLVQFDEKIQSISSGLGATLYVGVSGNLYGCGLAIDVLQEESSTKPKILLSDIKSAVVCNMNIFAVDKNGALFTKDNQNEINSTEFSQINMAEAVRDILTDNLSKTAIISESGVLYTLNTKKETEPQKLFIDTYTADRIRVSGDALITSDKNGNWFFYDNKSNQLLGDKPTPPTPFVLEVSE